MITGEPVTCEFWEGPMHGQIRVIRTSELVNGLLEVLEVPPGEITKVPKPLIVHVYRWPGNNSLLYQGVKQALFDPPKVEQTPPAQT